VKNNKQKLDDKRREKDIEALDTDGFEKMRGSIELLKRVLSEYHALWMSS
jgi:hypothetical protein